jgi:D-alanyl-D-alanine carboxypeptidase
MNTYLFNKVLVLILFLAPCKQIHSQTFSPALAAMLQDTLSYYNTAIGNIKGMAVSVYIPGQGMWQSTTGVSHAGAPITLDMKFDIASNSKLFVAAALLKMQENNILDLDNHLSQWLPTFPNINPNITIRQLLNHTSGIPDVIFYQPYLDSIKNNPTRVFTPLEVVSWVTSSNFPAGTSWAYSNTNYILAGMVALAATGLTISQYIRSNILNPLNMDSSFFDVQEPPVGTIAHRWWNGITNPTLSDYHNVSRVSLNTAVGAAGGLFSTASEMAQWYNALFSGQVLTPASMAELTTFVTIPNNTVQQYGLGLYRETTMGLTYWEHGGATWGYKSKIMYDSCSGLVVCGLANAYPSGMTSIPFLLYRVVKNHVPGCSGVITGSTTVCQRQNNVTYSVAGITNATSYIWTLPNGATGTSNTTSITVNYGAAAVSGNISVRGNNTFGVGASSKLPIIVNETPNINVSSSSNPICSAAPTTLNVTGANSYSWLPLSVSGASIIVSPNSTTTYTVIGTSSLGCTNTMTIAIIVDPCMLTLNLKLYLQGYYAGNNIMNIALFNQGILANINITDSITVELRNALPPYSALASSKTIIDKSGMAFCNFSSLSGSYYIVVKNRNHIETWSATPIAIGTNSTYNFTTAANKAYGANQSEVESGVWALYSGDLNSDENIDLLDLALLEFDINNFAFGYLVTDINGDGNIDLLDTPVVEGNINGFVFSNHP